MPLPVIPPAGVTLAGFFVPSTYAAPGEPPGILADAIDPGTGDFLSIERGFDPTDAAVLTALTVERRSGAAAESVGQRYRDQRLVDNNTEQFVTSETQRALKALVDSKQIKLERVTTFVGDDWAEAQVVWQNLATRRRMDPTLPIGGAP